MSSLSLAIINNNDQIAMKLIEAGANLYYNESPE